jgi:hypothetical protein
MRLATWAIAAVLASAVALLATAAADASTYRSCRSADLRHPFQPGGHDDFGVFRLRIDGGSCTGAHRVAAAWMDEFEASFEAGRLELPRKALGFTFKSLTPTAAQTYAERGRKGSATIRFDYRVPNG